MDGITENVNDGMAEENAAEVAGTMVDEKIAELVGKLPKELRPLAETFAPVLIAMSVREIQMFVNGAMTDPVDEYRRLYARLNTQQAIEAGETLKEYWQSLNVVNANVVLEQNKAMDDLLVVGLLMLKVSMA